MSAPDHHDDAALERPAKEAARGRSNRTPLLVLGGVGGTIAVVAGILITILLLVWWLL